MSPSLRGERAPTPEMPDYTERLWELAAAEDIPEEYLSERGLALATELLEEMYRRHGDPTSDTYKPYHNDQHALNVIKRSWRLWRALHARLPDRFDREGFELLMIAGAGHDVINDPLAAQEQPGQNEEASADFTRDKMIAYGYSGQDAQRVYNAIQKTTAQRNQAGVIVQTEMRKGDKGIMGLVLGQADMNGILIEGPTTLINDACEIWVEFTHTSVKAHPMDFTSFLFDEDKYLKDRAEALSDDLRYYVQDEQEREIIKQIYWDEFHWASIAAVNLAARLRATPEQTRRVVETALEASSRVAARGLERAVILKRHLSEHFDGSDEDKRD